MSKMPIKFVLFLSLTILAFQNCANRKQFSESSETVQALAEADATLDTSVVGSDKEIENCQFDGQTVLNGQEVTAYLTSSVQYGQSCAAQKRICNNGLLNGDYKFASCSVGAASACLLDGKNVSHNSPVLAYKYKSVKYGETCVTESRLCNDGVLSGSFQFKDCQVAAPSSCTLGTKTVAHGESIKAYFSSTVNMGQSCVSEDRICQNGQLTGSYTNTSCDVLKACGSADGVAAYSKPSSGLCANGTASAVTGNGTVSSPWSWSCNFNGTPYACAAATCSKLGIRVRSNSASTVNDPMRDIPFTGYAFALNAQVQVIGGDGTTVGVQMDTAQTYQQFRDALNNGIAANSALNGRVIVSLGENFNWYASDGSGTVLTGTELILSVINSADSVQTDGGYWITGGSSSGGGFGSSVRCVP